MYQLPYPDLTDQAIQEASKLIGVELRRYPRWKEAGKEMIIRFARAIGSRNPLYLSEELVSTNLLGTMLGHPTILYCFDDTFVAPPVARYPRNLLGGRLGILPAGVAT